MNRYTFELELTQLEELFNKSRSNKYSDPKKKNYAQQLHAILIEIQREDVTRLKETDFISFRQIFNFLYSGLEFLDNSTLNITPFETVFCLSKALEDWVDSENLIIVTSLSNRINDIYFEGYEKEQLRNTLQLIKSRYNLIFTDRLIRIALPKSLAKDYLSSVVLYHELGHFIDDELNITDKIFYQKYHCLKTDFTQEQYREYNHFKEFFADLFAAQYVNTSSSSFLNQIAYQAKSGNTHPATIKRIAVVNDFLNGKSNEIIAIIQKALHNSGKEKLKIRHSTHPTQNSPFSKLVPITVNNVHQLHGLFKLGWDLWQNSNRNFLKQFSRKEKYTVINNLMEKSISNYHVLEMWDKEKTELS